jgi:predicted DCC family thiol-disulfide oxidoreductase YuxK
MLVSKLVLFDGVCNLCNSSIQFIIKHDKAAKFKFAPLQSPLAAERLSVLKLGNAPFSSIIYVENDEVYQKSTAALKIAKHLDGAWPLLYAFMIVPKFIRDRVYDFIAKNRYKWFGKTEACWLPTPELKARFLDLA